MALRESLSKRQLEIQLEKLKTLQSPRLELEQYPISSRVAAELLFMAGFAHRDLQGTTIDLGTGTGRLAIGAAIMGSTRVVGVDVDEQAISIAKQNARVSGVKIEWVVADIAQVSGKYDTVIMNPPYGTRAPHADLRFLERGFELAPVAYSIHKSSTRNYLKETISSRNRTISEMRSMTLRIPHLFPFHRKKWEEVEVDLYRIVS